MLQSQQKSMDQIWKYLTGPQPKAELKMIASLEATYAQGASTSMIQPPHFEFNMHNPHLPELVTDSISLNAQISWLASAPLQYPVIIEEAPTMPAPSHTPPQYQQFVEDPSVPA